MLFILSRYRNIVAIFRINYENKTWDSNYQNFGRNRLTVISTHATQSAGLQGSLDSPSQLSMFNKYFIQIFKN